MFGQPSPDSICLAPWEFDYYAQGLVDRKQLIQDTFVLNRILKSKDVIIHQKDIQIGDQQTALVAKDSVVSIHKRAYLKKISENEKLTKKVKVFKSLSLILGSSTLILVLVLLIIV